MLLSADHNSMVGCINQGQFEHKKWQ